MTHELIAAPLAAALTERGYQTLTAVQQAMLDPDSRGRDLLVSAQTGSGKTVAFGLAAASDLLDGDPIMLPEGTAPLALAIAPTRELALQVAAELAWLYAATGARIATCVGGMDYRAERRALAHGAQIVVGTPGRLRDHIQRGSLDLSAMRVVVLDEADEMLDLGFREDLEFILQAAPDSRRTLMFSATVPAAIDRLARDFQRDSLRIAAMGEARQHGDITYRALSIAARDRDNAIFNLLRFHEARTAIVFCKTRANVNHLLARMGNRGFRVVALSGELSQQERSHALQALRDGRARVCIATDVAARGIDLPGLELVIHADLPTNSETLLHRSGRTGRAGAKGVSALLVAPAEFRKAQRLLQGASVVAEWGKPPSADEVSAQDDLRMLADPALSGVLDDMTIARELLARFGAEQVAAGFVRQWREGRPPPEELSEAAAPTAAAPRPPRDFGASVWFTLSVGRTGRAEPRWLLPKICEAGGITRDAIGAIRVQDQETHVEIAADNAPRFDRITEIAPGLLMRRLTDAPPTDHQPRRPRPAKAPAPADEPQVRARKAPPAPAPDLPAAPAPAWSPLDAATEIAPEAKPQKKPRWSMKEKRSKAGKAATSPAPGRKQGTGKGKSGGWTADKPRARPALSRRSRGGNAPPLRRK